MVDLSISKVIQTTEVNNVQNLIKYKNDSRATKTPDKCKGKIKCYGELSISCWPATLLMRPYFKLGYIVKAIVETTM
jgi:hypothetical protein